jgi:regulator of protease activity HflC (stomatin/prohibitin superfamily)
MSDIKPKLPVSAAGLLGFVGRVLGRILKSRLFWIAAVPLLIVYCSAGAFTTYVPPNMVAVMQVVYGSNAGIRKETLPPGLHFIVPSVDRLYLFARDLQVVNFSDSPSEVSQQSKTAPAVKLLTSDGYSVTLDVSILYRVEDAYRVFTEAGPGRGYEDKLVVPRADRILRKTLGELNAEEFYAGPKRIEKATLAREQLSAELATFGVHLEAVLVRRYEYDQKYQALIEGRKVKDQTVFWRQAEAQSEIEKRKRDTVIAEGAAAAKTELQRGEAEVQKIRAEADLYERKQAAQGKLLVATAEAQGTKLESDAYLNTGAENLVGLRMAEILRGVRVLVLPSDGKEGLNPLDVAALLNKLEVK